MQLIDINPVYSHAALGTAFEGCRVLECLDIGIDWRGRSALADQLKVARWVTLVPMDTYAPGDIVDGGDGYAKGLLTLTEGTPSFRKVLALYYELAENRIEAAYHADFDFIIYSSRRLEHFLAQVAEHQALKKLLENQPSRTELLCGVYHDKKEGLEPEILRGVTAQAAVLEGMEPLFASDAERNSLPTSLAGLPGSKWLKFSKVGNDCAVMIGIKEANAQKPVIPAVARSPNILVSWMCSQKFTYSENAWWAGRRQSTDIARKRLQTKVGEYDLAEVLAKIPKSEFPELFVAGTDGFGENMPRNLAAFNGTKVLFVGDTHHGKMPLRRVLKYLSEEQYDYVFSIYNPQHLHFLSHAVSASKLGFIPCFNLPTQIAKMGYGQRNDLCLSGRISNFHPYRSKVLSYLLGKGERINIGALTPHAKLQANSRISLNLTLNGDFNMRTFEIPACGSLALVDKPAQQNRLSLLFQEGVHYETFSSPEELTYKIQMLNADRSGTEAKGRAAYAHYWRNYSQEQLRQILERRLAGQALPMAFRVDVDPRFGGTKSKTIGELFNRVVLYEAIQELHRKSTQVKLIASAGLPFEHLSDLADLPRLNVERIPSFGERDIQFSNFQGQCGIENVKGYSDKPIHGEYELGLALASELNTLPLPDGPAQTKQWCILSDVELSETGTRWLETQRMRRRSSTGRWTVYASEPSILLEI